MVKTSSSLVDTIGTKGPIMPKEINHPDTATDDQSESVALTTSEYDEEEVDNTPAKIASNKNRSATTRSVLPRAA